MLKIVITKGIKQNIQLLIAKHKGHNTYIICIYPKNNTFTTIEMTRNKD